MTTYTLAFDRDLLIAVFPDGGDATAEANRQSGSAYNDPLTVTKTIEGVTLTDAVADEDDERIVYSGHKMGWLSDETGRVFKYAVK
jgi:hypothetical protein